MAEHTSLAAEGKIRLDRYLWACRLCRTRSLARAMIGGGKVDYNGVRAKPSRCVEVGARICLPWGRERLEIVVLALSAVRGPYSSARLLYAETAASAALRAKQRAPHDQLLGMPQPSPHRPNKKQRRELQKFKAQNPH